MTPPFPPCTRLNSPSCGGCFRDGGVTVAQRVERSTWRWAGWQATRVGVRTEVVLEKKIFFFARGGSRGSGTGLTPVGVSDRAMQGTAGKSTERTTLGWGLEDPKRTRLWSGGVGKNVMSIFLRF